MMVKVLTFVANELGSHKGRVGAPHARLPNSDCTVKTAPFPCTFPFNPWPVTDPNL